MQTAQNTDGFSYLCRSSLWTFVYDLLEKDNTEHIIVWTDRNNFEFRVNNTEELARTWGLLKGRKNMTYAKFSRALRYYYGKGVLEKVARKRLTFRFIESSKTKSVLSTRPKQSHQSAVEIENQINRSAEPCAPKCATDSFNDDTSLQPIFYECCDYMSSTPTVSHERMPTTLTFSCQYGNTGGLSLSQPIGTNFQSCSRGKEERVAQLKNYLKNGSSSFGNSQRVLPHSSNSYWGNTQSNNDYRWNFCNEILDIPARKDEWNDLIQNESNLCQFSARNPMGSNCGESVFSFSWSGYTSAVENSLHGPLTQIDPRNDFTNVEVCNRTTNSPDSCACSDCTFFM